jgi:hypothetical protein
MTVTDAPEWTLSDLAWGQLTGCGIALSELYRLIRKPAQITPTGIDGEKRVSGYGLTAVISGNCVKAVEIDGADSENWSEWARERAYFGDGDVAAADAMVREHLGRRSGIGHERTPSGRTRPRRSFAEKEFARLMKALDAGTPSATAGELVRSQPALPPAQRLQPLRPPAETAPPELTQTRESEPDLLDLVAARADQGSEVLDQIHPALRREITRQVAGDWSRIVVLSPTKVQILPEE